MNKRILSSLSQTSRYIPKHNSVSELDVVKLSEFITSNKKILVLTGAGISTESGIPDYRSEEVGLYARSTTRPVQFNDFLKNSKIRQRYWARNFVGWPRFSSISPNTTHSSLKILQNHDLIGCIVTQNVDNLHFKAGSKKLIELHGTAFRVVCLTCRYNIHRQIFQSILVNMNPTLEADSLMVNPDGDVEVKEVYKPII
jgi:NAD-dependent deacetylase sirtuin 4